MTWTVCADCAAGICGVCTLDLCDCRKADPDGHIRAAEAMHAEQRPLPELDAPDWYSQEAMALFDERTAASTAVAKIAANAAPWVATATEALRRVSYRRERVTSDDVWLELKRAGVPRPHDTRAIGAVMRHGIDAGWLDSTPISADTRPKVWKSRLYGRYDLINQSTAAA